jgi:hypothetical protein
VKGIQKMDRPQPSFSTLAVKTIVTHSVTYMILGLLASTLLDYGHLFADSSLNLLMRPVSDPLVMAGPLFQPVRGFLFGIVFYLLREPFFEKKNGWLLMWTVLVIVGILNTFGPTPGSVEGIIYTILPLWVHLRGLPEVLLQSLCLSLVLFYWVNHPGKRWLNWAMGIAFFINITLPVLGLLLGPAR